MPKIAIITDTDSSIPKSIASKFGIRQVPINIHFGMDTFRAVDEISDGELIDRVDREIDPGSRQRKPEHGARINGS